MSFPYEYIKNELSAFGYNRDGKKGKQQIVIGLLCNELGVPLSVEVFPGNTQDSRTFASQINKAAERFGGGEVTFVGDRGMIKSGQIEESGLQGFHYIAAITKPQVEGLLKAGVFQMKLFDQGLAEVQTNEGIRYVLRRNPVQAEEIKKSREDKLLSLRQTVDKQNKYLMEHKQAKVETALRWQALDVTVAEGIAELSTLCAHEVSFNGKETRSRGLQAKCNQIPTPRASVKRLIEAAKIKLPEVLLCSGVIVTTKKKLTSRRKLL